MKRFSNLKKETAGSSEMQISIRLHDIAFQKTVIFVFMIMKTPEITERNSFLFFFFCGGAEQSPLFLRPIVPDPDDG
jgi:hypothetical protein